MCIYDKNDESIIYSILENIIYVRSDDLEVQYYIEYDKFSCNSSKSSFILENNEVFCNSIKCDDYKEIYNKYYNNLIKKYLI